MTKALAIAVILSHSAVALATEPSTQPTNKWSYTLFNPTPPGDLREMDTDRPNKTNTPHTIDAGHLQIETGFFDYNYYRDKYQNADSRTDTLDLAQFNFRLGILNSIELNAVVNSVDFLRNTDYDSNQSSRQGGFGDLVVGGKLNFWGNDAGEAVWATSLGIQPQFKIPTAREDLGNAHAEMFIGLPFLMNLPAGIHLGLQPTVSWERATTNAADVTGWQNSISIDRTMIEKFDVYIEYWSHLSTQRHQEAQQTLDLGFTYPLTDNITFDTALNFGLNHASDSLEFLAGVSVRF